jgi:glycosyltransferase involved in cell wall biosynthesis
MIVKNEEEVLERCLNSVKEAADEIIIVDTGSTDRTKEIAEKFTDKVYDFVWTEDFSAARNESYKKATMDYQMWLDADDVLPEPELKKLLELKNTLDPETDIVTMKYITHFDEHGVPIATSTRERLSKRSKGYLWADPIHEYILMAGNIVQSDIVIHHKKIHKEGRSDRNLNIYNKLEASGAVMTMRQIYYFARELRDHGMWAKSVYYFERFLHSGQGWVEDNIASCLALSILYNILGEQDKILPILTKSFTYAPPRPDICCEFGYFYKRVRDYTKALQWFKLAANLGEPDSVGFIQRDYLGYIPNIECCVCCAEMGDMESAKKYNEKAAEYKPNSPGVEHNRRYFASL